MSFYDEFRVTSRIGSGQFLRLPDVFYDEEKKKKILEPSGIAILNKRN